MPSLARIPIPMPELPPDMAQRVSEARELRFQQRRALDLDPDPDAPPITIRPVLVLALSLTTPCAEVN